MSNTDDAFKFNCLLWGESGVGKTPLAATLAACEQTAPCLLLDVDKGAMSVVEEPRPTIFRITAWVQVDKIYKLMRDGKWADLAKFVECEQVLEYKSIVIDSGTELEVMCRKLVQSESGNDEIPSQPDYLKAQERFKPLYRHLRDLPCMSMVMTAGVRDLREDVSGIVKYYPAFTPGLVHDLVRMTDLVMYQDTKEEDKKWLHILQTHVSRRIIARSRSPKLKSEYKGEKLHFRTLIADMVSL
jgi:hypothetical protein